MTNLRKKFWFSLVLALAFVFMAATVPHGVAGAACVIYPGSNAFANCYQDDTDGISTGAGDDRVEIGSVVISGGSPATVSTAAGNDKVNSHGAIQATGDGVDLGTGTDELINNPGASITAGDDGVLCSPQAGQFCGIYNIGASISARNEGIEVISNGGSAHIRQDGTIESANGRGIYVRGAGSFEIKNNGSITSTRHGIESYGGALTLTNIGTIYSKTGRGVDLDPNADTVRNAGTIKSDVDPAIDLSSGNDTLHNNSVITATNDNPADSVIEASYGNDAVTNTTRGRISGTGFAAVELGYGSDTMIIQGGSIEGLIHGDGDYGTRDSDRDVLIFEFSGTTASMDAFRALMQGKSAESGSVTWGGNTYTWVDFEEIRLNLTATDGGSSVTPQPTAPPTAQPTVQPTTPAPTAQPTTPAPTPAPTQTLTVPAGVTAKSHTPLTGSRTLELRWEDVGADPAKGVTHYVVTFWYGTFKQQWTFNRADIRCTGTDCYASVTLPDTVNRAYWKVEAFNAAGSGGSDNTKSWTY